MKHRETKILNYERKDIILKDTVRKSNILLTVVSKREWDTSNIWRDSENFPGLKKISFYKF